MKIINNINDMNLEDKYIVCPDCDCEFIYSEKDKHIVDVKEHHNFAIINCPNCGCELMFKTND